MIAELFLCAALTLAPLPEPEPPEPVPEQGPAGGEVVEVLPPEEGDLIVFPDDLTAGDGTSDDEIQIDGGNEDESVSDSGNNTVLIISPDDLATILQDADDIALLSNFGSSGNTLPSGSFLEYARGLAGRIGYNKHYVCWRDNSDYYGDSYFAYGDLEESGGIFTGSVRLLRYYRPTQNSDWSFEWSDDSSFRLDASNGFAYSDIGEFPALNGGESFEKVALLLLGVSLVFSVVLPILLGKYGR